MHIASAIVPRESCIHLMAEEEGTISCECTFCPKEVEGLNESLSLCTPLRGLGRFIHAACCLDSSCASVDGRRAYSPLQDRVSEGPQ